MAWIERIEKRQRNVKVFRDDVYPLRQKIEKTVHDQHYLDDAQIWQDADESLADDTTDGYAVSATKLRHIIRIGSTGTRRWYPRRDHLDEYVSFGRLQSWSGTAWVNVNLGAMSGTGKNRHWSTTAFDLDLWNNWHRIKIQAVLKTEAARRRLRWAASLTGLTWDNWQLRGQDGTIVGTIEKPKAWDANGSPDNPNVTITNTYSGGYVEFGGDLSGAVLPITIDPTFTDGYGGDVQTYFDTYLQQNAADTNYGSNNAIALKNQANFNQTGIVKFDASTLAGVTITSSILKLHTVATISGTTTGTANLILAANANITETGATWNYQDGANRWAGDAASNGGTDAGCSVSGTDFNGSAMGTWTFTDGEGTGTEYDVTLDNTQTESMIASNQGIRLTHSGSTTKSLGSSDNSNTTYRPVWVAEYTEGGAVELAPANIAQSQTLTAVALTQHNVLVVNSISQSQSTTNPALVQHNILVVNSVAQSQTTGNVALTQHNALAVDNLAQSQSLGAVDLTQHNTLAVANVTQSQTLNAVALTQHNALAVANIGQTQSLDAVVVTYHAPGAVALVVDNISQSQSVGAVSLTQHNILAVNNISQNQTLSAVIVVYHPSVGVVLVVANISQTQSLSNVDLTQHNVLTVANLSQSQTLDNIVFIAASALITPDERRYRILFEDRVLLIEREDRVFSVTE